MTELPLADRSVELVRAWVDPERPHARRPDPAARRLAHLVKDPRGIELTIGLIDRVIRPEDDRVAARHLRAMVRDLPPFLSARQRLVLKLGSLAAVLFPGLARVVARRTVRRAVGHLVVDGRPDHLGRTIKKLRGSGDQLNLTLLGEAVVGEAGAARRRDEIFALLRRDDVDHVSVTVSSVTGQLSPWSFDESVDRAVKHLAPLFAQAAVDQPKFIELDLQTYRDLHLTIAVFTRILDSFPDLEAGIVLPAYLPDSLDAMKKLQSWAARRRTAGGAPVRVRLVKGTQLAMERVEAARHGWPLAPWSTAREADTQYKRILHWALRPERVEAVRIAVATQNLFDIAYAWLLAGDHGVREALQVEMPLGLVTGPAAAVRDEVGALLLHAPVVRPAHLDAAIAYFVRELGEQTSTDIFSFEREAQGFVASVKELEAAAPATHRVQNRLTELPVRPGEHFANTPDTDPSVEANREWARLALARSSYTQLGSQTVHAGKVPGPASLETVIHQARAAAEEWQARGPEVRGWVLHQAANAMGARRGDLVSVMAAEAGKTVAESDAEISAAVDFAHYYAEAARRLEVVDGATFVPDTLTVVVTPWNLPVAGPARSVLAALAVGSAVIVKAAPQTRHSAAVMVEALWQAGVPREVLRFVTIDEGPLTQALISHSAVDRVMLTGAWETAQLFRSWRPALPLLAATSGKNAVVVTPSADLDLAVTDLVASAFGQTGQQCSAASLAILVGAVAGSERFRRQLVDAVSSLTVGLPDDLGVTTGPLIEAPSGVLAEGLTALDDGEAWLLAPRQLSPDGRLWSPGIRTGVRPGSRFHTKEYFGPVLGIMHASTLEQAIEWQNGTDYGLAAGIHSLDADEISTWIDEIDAGNLYVNRDITGTIAQRQPFGGWKRSSVGANAKSGGPSYLTRLGTWHPRPLRAVPRDNDPVPAVAAVLDAAERHVTPAELDDLKAAAASDEIAWQREYGVAKDVAGLGVERNLLRYVPAPVTVRFDGYLPELVRVLLAAARTGAPVTVSTRAPLPDGLAADVVVQTHDEWLAHVAQERPARVRLVGSDAAELATVLDGDPDVTIHAGPVTPSGRIEALPFLLEQSISITNHRFGRPHADPAFSRLLPR